VTKVRGGTPGRTNSIADAPVDLAISVDDGRSLAEAGRAVTYTITVTNPGSVGVVGATVTDVFPAELRAVTWTGAASRGAVCTARGAGDLHDTIDLPPGGSVTYKATGIIDPASTGTLVNEASVAAPAGRIEATPEDNTAVDVDTLVGPFGDTLVVSTAIDEMDDDFSLEDLSLREALIVTSWRPEEVFIRFDNALTGATITLDPLLGRLNVDADVEITGLGAEELTIDGADGRYVFHVANDSTASISGLSITGGVFGIDNRGTLTITDATIFDNPGIGVSNQNTLTISHVTISGGSNAIHNSGTLTLSHATISGHSSSGISNNGTLTISHATISNASGGISNTGTLTISDATIAGNMKVGDGGGIANSGGTVTLTGVMLLDNSSRWNGGAIANTHSGQLTVNNTTIAGNSAGQGGGAISNTHSGQLTIANTTISGNSADGEGGAIFNSRSSQLTVANTTISGNSAGREGGAISNSHSSQLTVANTAISGNSAGRGGGAIYNLLATTTLANVTVADNSAVREGGGVFNYLGTTIFTNVTIAGNSTGMAGAGLYVLGDEPVILHNTIVDDVYGPLAPASSHNLIGGNLQLGPLADNGGPTLTHAPLPGSPAIDAGSNDRALEAGLTGDQRGFARFVDGDDDGTATVDIGAFEARAPGVVRRQVFYNNSAFDGNDDSAGEADDGAIASDKQPLLPGQTATFANYISSHRGINGIMIDVANLPGAPKADDFEFRIGNDGDPANWAPVATAPNVTVREGVGAGHSDRVTIIWPDSTIQNTWLQVTVRPTANTGLAHPDVFYFGSAISEVGNSTTDAAVNAIDVLLTRGNPRNLTCPAPIHFPYDFNRDRRVNATDMLIAQNHQMHSLNALKLITAPDGGAKDHETSMAQPNVAVSVARPETEEDSPKSGLRSTRDVVWGKATVQEPPQEPAAFAKVDWLLELEHVAPSHEFAKIARTEEAVDELLRMWPS